MFTKILIANRGEIACRVAHTARQMGVKTVAVYSDADAQAQHVLACDEAVHIGGHAAKDSYLQWQRIIDAAKATGAQAIHPGYGFLSENADFANACAQAGVVFIGPPAQAIAAMGSKSAAKSLMEKAGVPLVPGYHGSDNSPEFLQAQAERIGYPVLIKASAGGGGRGMRRVDKAEDFVSELASCQREAQASFGDAHVLVERYVTRPRHIEIQVFGDTHGQYVHLFERDCSVQRRHQKVLEEAPAPGLSAARRAEMGAAAVAAAKAVGYVGAGTVEFIAEPTPDGDLHYYFMEMNTRLQVEHPVTEAITGLDLVAWQLLVASGEPLPLKQADLSITGHAIEARICAENPEAGFLPATGTLQVLNWPPHVRFQHQAASSSDGLRAPVRVDAGVQARDAISPYYDSMVAKLIVWGQDRAQALARMDAALAATHIVGLSTNVAFLRKVVSSQSFASADLDTALIERERPHLFEQGMDLPIHWAIAGLVAHEMQLTALQQSQDPWSHRDGWRMHGGAQRQFELLHDQQKYMALVSMQANGTLQLSVTNTEGSCLADDVTGLAMTTLRQAGHVHDISLDGERKRLTVYTQADKRIVFAEQGRADLQLLNPFSQQSTNSDKVGQMTAPMPGRVVALMTAVGDVVSAGQSLAVIEAMKMEHTLHAPRDGVVAELLYAVGDQVAEGAALIRLKDADSVKT